MNEFDLPCGCYLTYTNEEKGWELIRSCGNHNLVGTLQLMLKMVVRPTNMQEKIS